MQTHTGDPKPAPSPTECFTGQLFFDELGARNVVADFSGGQLSSDGGALLLRQIDSGLGVTRTLAACFVDRRDPALVDHSVRELLAQRIYALALGYEDLNDHTHLRRIRCWPRRLGRRMCWVRNGGAALIAAQRWRARRP